MIEILVIFLYFVLGLMLIKHIIININEEIKNRDINIKKFIFESLLVIMYVGLVSKYFIVVEYIKNLL